MVDLQQRLDEIHGLNAEVIGISSTPTTQQMVDKFNLTFPMLFDEDASVCQHYKAYDEATQKTKSTTYVIDKQGLIYAKYPTSLGDSTPILEDLRLLENGAL